MSKKLKSVPDANTKGNTEWNDQGWEAQTVTDREGFSWTMGANTKVNFLDDANCPAVKGTVVKDTDVDGGQS